MIVDTGVLLGAADTDDADHVRCAQLLRGQRGQLKVPAPVIAETSWQIERNLGHHSEARFLRLITSGELLAAELTVEDYQRCVGLIDTYHDLGLGFVDASVVAVAERLGVTTITTLNHRDFTVVRARHCEAIALVP